MADGGRSLRVLCLEDSPLDAELVSETLIRAGFRADIDLAPDRRRFEALLAGEPYDVILADFALPGFDAHRALELAKAAHPGTPFICVSGTIGEEATVELLKEGADDIVLKDKMARLPFAVQRAIDEAAHRRELDQASAALRESRERERFALRGTNDGLWDVRMDSGAVYVSPRGREILGYRPDEMAALAATWDQLVCPEDLPATQAALDAYLEGRVPIFDVEQRLRTASGEWKWIRARGAAVARDASGAPTRMVGTHSDISAQKRAEEALRLSAARLLRTVEGTVEAMGAMIAARDPYTADHEKRVTELAVAIAGEVGCDKTATEGLRLAGLVHDIGKLTVPAEILNKPSLLTPIEFELIKGHALAAFEILKSIEFDYPVADIVVQHHERLDGSGYPAGLKGDEILREARILAVADVVEAMASHRPYRAALGLEAALAEVAAGAGARYDPEAVAACAGLFAKGFSFSDL
jgi:PAS domain S-box-containing protein/putative nucleotidyltransferase with HDIG domain